MKIHICLVSKQPLANLIPLKVEALKPEKVILLVSKDMQREAQQLQELLHEWQIKEEVRSIEPYDLEKAEEVILDALTSFRKEDDITLNITGGTKLMSLAAYGIFRGEEGRSILYVDTQDSCIKVLQPKAEDIPFGKSLNVRSYLKAYGQEVVNDQKPKKQRKELLYNLINKVRDFKDSFPTLNYHASKARKGETFPYNVDIEKPEKMDALLRMLAESGEIGWDGEQISFPSPESARFCSGGWLEEYCAFLVKECFKEADCKLGLEVRHTKQGRKEIKNEYDVVFTLKNRLFLIECKTQLPEQKNQQNKDDMEMIYKLDSLKEAAGGVYGRAMFLTLHNISKYARGRCIKSGIVYCEASNHNQIKKKLKELVGE